jgi:hypothetical protein
MRIPNAEMSMILTVVATFRTCQENGARRVEGMCCGSDPIDETEVDRGDDDSKVIEVSTDRQR